MELRGTCRKARRDHERARRGRNIVVVTYNLRKIGVDMKHGVERELEILAGGNERPFAIEVTSVHYVLQWSMRKRPRFNLGGSQGKIT